MKSEFRRKQTSQVPPSFKTHFRRLFGSEAAIAKKDALTDTEWRHALHEILIEFEQYLHHNIQSDELHMYMIYASLLMAEESLKETNFWPPFTEAILRVGFLLMGDYPDHRRRKGGRKREGHYNLQLFRSVHYTQDIYQRMRTLRAVPRYGMPKLEKDPDEALREWRNEAGFSEDYVNFFKWYREKYGKDYALIF